MSEDFSIEDERNAGRDIWKLITTVLDIPESSDSPRDYWDDVMEGTCILLGLAYKLALELETRSGGGHSMPTGTKQAMRLFIEHKDEIEKAWLRVLV